MSSEQPSPDAGRPKRLQRGDAAYVKPGATHFEYPDLPMGGWTGTIERIQKKDRDRRYWVHFSSETTERLHPVYMQREDRDYRFGYMPYDGWVSDYLLAPGEAPPEVIEQPDLPPWAERAGDRQIQALFGLQEGEAFPECEVDALEVWHRFLTEHLPLPREIVPADGMDEEWIERIYAPDETPADVYDVTLEGLYCELRNGLGSEPVPLYEVGLLFRDPYRTLLQDYAYWYNRAGLAPDDADDDESEFFDDDDDDGGSEELLGLSASQRRRLWESLQREVMGTSFGEETPIDAELAATAALAEQLSQSYESDEVDDDAPPEPLRAAPRTGRNDPCPCGSGKKYKKCCLHRDSGG